MADTKAEAEIYLNFVARGTTESGKSVSDVGKRVAEAGAASKGFSERMQSAGAVGNKVFGSLNAVVGGFVGGSLASWIQRGQAGTVEANRLAFAIQRIGFNIASIFQPWIERAVSLVERFRDRTEALTGAQQRQIREWVALGASLTFVLNILPKIAAAAAVTSRALGGVTAAQAVAGGAGARAAVAGGTGRAAGAGAAGMAGGPLGMAAVGLVALLSASKEGREALGSLAKAVAPLAGIFIDLSRVVAGLIGPLAELIGTVTKGVTAAAGWTANLLATEGPMAMLPRLIAASAAGKLTDPEIFKDVFGFGGGKSPEDFLKRLGMKPGEEKKTELTPAGGGMEAVTALYGRIAGTATRTAAQQTADNTKKLVDEIGKFWDLFNKEAGRRGNDDRPQE